MGVLYCSPPYFFVNPELISFPQLQAGRQPTYPTVLGLQAHVVMPSFSKLFFWWSELGSSCLLGKHSFQLNHLLSPIFPTFFPSPFLPSKILYYPNNQYKVL